MLKGLAIFIFILGASFYLILPKEKAIPAEKAINNAEVQFLTQKIAGREEAPAPAENIIPERSEDHLSLDEIQEKLDDIAEQIDILAQEVAELVSLRQVAGAETSSFTSTTVEATEDKEEAEEISTSTEIIVDDSGEKETLGQKLCSIEQGFLPERNKIIINELAWMGTPESSADEWLELKNISGAEINLAGWQILSRDGQIKIIFKEEDSILPGVFYILERTNDKTLPRLSADKIYTGALKNDGDNFYLFDENCQLQDEVLAFSGWPAGDNNSKRTMERKPNFIDPEGIPSGSYGASWQTSASAGGTPKSENSAGYYESFSFSGGVVILPQKPAYLKILISEIQIAGEESEKDDFVELYNPNYEDIDLTGWYLQRKTETGEDFATYVSNKLLAQKIIKSQSYFLAANASSSFSFLAQATTTNPLTENNTLVLKNPNGDMADKVGFGNAQDFEGATTTNPAAGQSIGRKRSTSTENYIDTDNNYDDFEDQTPTPGLANQSFLAESATSSEATRTEATTTEDLPLPEPEPGTTTPDIPYQAVVINEIAWMGTSASTSADEWIEILNNTVSDIDLTGWTISAADGTPNITFLTSSISAQSHFLLERTDDSTVQDILADLIYTGALGNDGEKLELRDASSTLIDSVDCSSGWLAGDNRTKETMERINPLLSGDGANNWASSTDPGGTPKSKNSVSGPENF